MGGAIFKVMSLEKKYSVHEQYEIADKEKRRTRSDAELLKDGAQYRVNEEGEKTLEATQEQKYIIDKYRNYGDKEKITEFIDELRRKAAKGPDNLEAIMRFGGRDKEIRKVMFTLINGRHIKGNIDELNVEEKTGMMAKSNYYLTFGGRPDDSAQMSDINYYTFIP